MIRELLGLPPTTLVIFLWVFFYYLFKLIDFLPAYKDIDTFVNYHLHSYPESPICYLWKGDRERRQGRLWTALDYWRMGLILRKEDFRLNFNCASILNDLGKYSMAKSFIDVAAANPPLGNIEKANMVINHLRNIVLENLRRRELYIRKEKEKNPNGPSK